MMEIQEVYDMSDQELETKLAIEVMNWIPIKGEWWLEQDQSNSFDCSAIECEGWAAEIDMTNRWGVIYANKRYIEIPIDSWGPCRDYNHVSSMMKISMKHSSKLLLHYLLVLLQQDIQIGASMRIEAVQSILLATPRQLCEAIYLSFKNSYIQLSNEQIDTTKSDLFALNAMFKGTGCNL
jgi:hypothetical protein